MKKSLFFVAAATLVLASCNNDVKIDENVALEGSNAQKEISLTSYAQRPKRVKSNAPVDGTDFTPTTIKVAAYNVTNGEEFFSATNFTNAAGDGTGTWKGNKYWPLSPAYINFVAYSELTTAGDPAVTWGGSNIATWTLAMSDNSSAQKDLMYAIGNGAVTQSGNALTFPTNVPMTFEHAQAWISFYADAYDATSGGKVTLNSITLNGASYAGTYTLTFTNYDANASQTISGAWSSLGAKGTDGPGGTGDPTSAVASLGTPNTTEVPGWTPATIAYDGSGDGVAVGAGLLIVPDDNALTADFKSFTINYTLDGKTYDFTYTPATANVDQKKHYIYNINFHLHEIEVRATVTDWDDQTPVDVPVY